MKPAMKLIFFFIFVFIIGMVYRTFDSFGVDTMQDAYDNSSLSGYTDSTIETVYGFLWIAIPIIAIVSLAIYFTVYDKGGVI